MTLAAQRTGPVPPKSSRMKMLTPPDALTVVEANVDVGPGNSLYIRGCGDGLRWDCGQRLNRGFGGAWIWTTSKAKGTVRFRILLNDNVWAKGKEVTVKAGKLIEVAPVF